MCVHIECALVCATSQAPILRVSYVVARMQQHLPHCTIQSYFTSNRAINSSCRHVSMSIDAVILCKCKASFSEGVAPLMFYNMLLVARAPIGGTRLKASEVHRKTFPEVPWSLIALLQRPKLGFNHSSNPHSSILILSSIYDVPSLLVEEYGERLFVSSVVVCIMAKAFTLASFLWAYGTCRF